MRRKTESRKRAILAFAVVAITMAVTTSMLVYPTFAEEQALQRKHVYARARDIAIQKIDNETIKTPVNLELALVLGEKRGCFIPVLNVKGSIDVNGTIYTIEYGDDIIQTQRHWALIRCVGSNAEGLEEIQVTLRLGAAYFWWGGDLYAFRAKALLRIADTPTLLLLRGIAKVQ